jgi:branched-chain amino acid transport system permease protein
VTTALQLASRLTQPRLRRAWAALALAAAVALPFMFSTGHPFVDDCIVALAYVVMALGLNIIVGYAGLLDLGYVAFFAIGAYTIGWLGSGFFFDANGGAGLHVGVGDPAAGSPGIHLTFLFVLFFAIVLTTVAGVAIGLPTLHLRGDYIAIVTLAFGEIIGRLAINGDEINIGRLWDRTAGALPLVPTLGEEATLTGGRRGITPVDRIDLPGLPRFGALDLRPWYFTILAVVVIAVFVTRRLRESRHGRAWIAIREDEVAAASMGIPLVRTKLLAYGVGAAFGGVAGAFLGSYLNTVNADQFQFQFSIFILAMVVLGGLGSATGVIVGAVALAFLNNFLIPDVINRVPATLGWDFDFTQVSYGVFGFLLVIMMVLRPEGLVPERRHRAGSRGGDAAQPGAVEGLGAGRLA